MAKTCSGSVDIGHNSLIFKTSLSTPKSDAVYLRIITHYFSSNLSHVEIHKFNFIRPFAFILHAFWLASSAAFQELPSQDIISSFPTYHELRVKLISDLTLQ